MRPAFAFGTCVAMRCIGGWASSAADRLPLQVYNSRILRTKSLICIATVDGRDVMPNTVRSGLQWLTCSGGSVLIPADTKNEHNKNAERNMHNKILERYLLWVHMCSNILLFVTWLQPAQHGPDR